MLNLSIICKVSFVERKKTCNMEQKPSLFEMKMMNSHIEGKVALLRKKKRRGKMLRGSSFIYILQRLFFTFFTFSFLKDEIGNEVVTRTYV